MKSKNLMHCSLTAGLMLAGLTLAPVSFADEPAVDNPPVIAPTEQGDVAGTPPQVDTPVTDEVADQGDSVTGTLPQVDEPVSAPVDVPVVDDVVVPTRGVEGMPEAEGANFRSNDNLPSEGDVAPLSYNMAPGGGASENLPLTVPEASIDAANAAIAASTADALSAAQDATTSDAVATPGVVEARVDDQQPGTGPVIRDGHLIAR